jgi:putative DNA primase/helicase
LFDRDKVLLNCHNGTFNLQTMVLQPHAPSDFITKMCNVKYAEGEVCERWEQFVHEVMSGDMETARFLQKALGYSLSGDTSHECFFVLHGSKTRNGKSTLMETVGNILGAYARTVQPQTLSRRSNDGSVASPDTARLKGARLVKTSELERRMALNTALIKQLTGGDTYTARFLHENPVEFLPQFKIFMNTNHLPHAEDDTVFTSGRIKLVPFDRHFEAEEQDKGLKKLFSQGKHKSGILNWLLHGYQLLQAEGLEASPRMMAALAAYRKRACKIAFNAGVFINEILIPAEGQRVKTSVLYDIFALLARDNGWELMSRPAFIAKLEECVTVKRHSTLGHTVLNHALKSQWQNFGNRPQEVSQVS